MGGVQQECPGQGRKAGFGEGGKPPGKIRHGHVAAINPSDSGSLSSGALGVMMPKSMWASSSCRGAALGSGTFL